MKTLAELYAGLQAPEDHGDKGTAHSYIEVYEELLRPYRAGSTVLEIGVAQGLSLKLWSAYFTDALVVGVDLDDAALKARFPGERFRVVLADATRPELLPRLGALTFDVVIDDGSHVLEDQLKTFLLLKPRMRRGGLYVIEDIYDLDGSRPYFEALHPSVEVVDRRAIKNRFDDALVVYRFP